MTPKIKECGGLQRIYRGARWVTGRKAVVWGLGYGADVKDACPTRWKYVQEKVGLEVGRCLPSKGIIPIGIWRSTMGKGAPPGAKRGRGNCRPGEGLAHSIGKLGPPDPVLHDDAARIRMDLTTVFDGP